MACVSSHVTLEAGSCASVLCLLGAAAVDDPGATRLHIHTTSRHCVIDVWIRWPAWDSSRGVARATRRPTNVDCALSTSRINMQRHPASTCHVLAGCVEVRQSLCERWALISLVSLLLLKVAV